MISAAGSRRSDRCCRRRRGRAGRPPRPPMRLNGKLTIWPATPTIRTTSTKMPNVRQNAPRMSTQDRRIAARTPSRSSTIALGTVRELHEQETGRRPRTRGRRRRRPARREPRRRWSPASAMPVTSRASDDDHDDLDGGDEQPEPDQRPDATSGARAAPRRRRAARRARRARPRATSMPCSSAVPKIEIAAMHEAAERRLRDRARGDRAAVGGARRAAARSHRGEARRRRTGRASGRPARRSR